MVYYIKFGKFGLKNAKMGDLNAKMCIKNVKNWQHVAQYMLPQSGILKKKKKKKNQRRKLP